MFRLHAQLNRTFQEIRLSVEDSKVYFWPCLASAVDTPDQEEECELLDITCAEEGDGGWRAEVLWKSSIWESKKHCYLYRGGRLAHWIEVTGSGAIAEVTFLSGTVSGQERGSLPGFGLVYVGCPNFLDKPWSHPSEYTAISAGNVTELWGSALTSGPLMLAFGEYAQDGWIAAGVFAKPGGYRFHTMAFNKKRTRALATQDNIIGTQAITLDYHGSERVDGTWVSPKIVFFAEKDAQACLQRHCRDAYSEGYAPQPASKKCDWWAEPIFCTWHEQVALGQIEVRGRLRGKQALEGAAVYADKCTQANVERWLNLFEQNDIQFGTIILDAGWQQKRGGGFADEAKFPDLRGFIDGLHGRDQHVMLHMNAWQTNDIPTEWCVTRDGEPVMADPTHPSYREYVEKMLERMLGERPGCYSADGLKIDGTSVLPGGPRLHSHGDLYGFELLHAYLKLMYDAAKAVKPEALISIFSANPIFADCCDMARTGDLYSFRADPIHTLRWRAEVIRAGLPHALVDTDGCLRFSMREDVEELLLEQVALGIPCLYQAEHLIQMRALTPNRVRKLTDEDYRLIREALTAYQRRRRCS